MNSPARTDPLILGLGNTIRSDDAAGIKTAREIKRLRKNSNVRESSCGGLDLLEFLSGFSRAVIIDSIKTGRRKPGEILRLTPEDFRDTFHLSSPHTVNFTTALELGRSLGYSIPGEIAIYAIEIADNLRYSKKCSRAVESAIPGAARIIIKEQLDA